MSLPPLLLVVCCLCLPPSAVVCVIAADVAAAVVIVVVVVVVVVTAAVTVKDIGMHQLAGEKLLETTAFFCVQVPSDPWRAKKGTFWGAGKVCFYAPKVVPLDKALG